MAIAAPRAVGTRESGGEVRDSWAPLLPETPEVPPLENPICRFQNLEAHWALSYKLGAPESFSRASA